MSAEACTPKCSTRAFKHTYSDGHLSFFDVVPY